MSPTVFREEGYRFYFFSREEQRVHVHVHCADGEAKFWIVPKVALAHNAGLAQEQLTCVQRIIEERKREIARAWSEHFGG